MISGLNKILNKEELQIQIINITFNNKLIINGMYQKYKFIFHLI
jgi:hypothetical protein